MIRCIDLEVENHEWYGQTASLHNPDNYIVEAGWLDLKPGEQPDYNAVQTHRNNSLEESLDTSWFNLDGVTVLVAHNAAYEIHAFLCRHKEEFEKFLKRGGRVYDTQWAEYLLTDYVHQYPALDEVAPKYGGTQKVDGIKILWEQGVLTSQIDPDLLHEYLAGPEGDVVNTAKVFLGQYSALQKRGQLPVFWERMDANLAFAYCEYNGLKVDEEVANRNKAEREQELKELQEAAERLLPDDLPEGLDFSWSSDYHVSALLYGGSIPYRKRVSYDPIRYEKADYYELTNGEFVLVDEWDEWRKENDARLVHEGLDRKRYQRGKNMGLPRVVRRDTEEEKLKWGEFLYHFKGVLDLDSLPPVLRDKFDKEWQGSRTLRCGTPVYSCSGEVYKALATHGFDAGNILDGIAEVSKDLGSFYLRETVNAKGEVVKRSGMMQYIQPDGFIHHQLNTCATVTGRLSASRPNTQQFPRADEDGDGEVKSKVKEMFVSRFGDNGYIIQIDYSALEVVMLAALSGDEALLRHMQNGTDMHCLRLAGVLGESYESVLEKCKNHQHPEHAHYARMRNDIKPRAFAYQYGATAMGIAYATGCSVEEARDFIAAENKLFPQALALRGLIAEETERTGMQEPVQREMSPDGRWVLFRRGYYTAGSGIRYSFRQHLQWNSDLRTETMQYRPTQMANYPIQGESFLVMAVAFGRMIRWWLQSEHLHGKAYLINNVHDAAYWDVHKDVALEVATAAKEIMESTPKYMDEKLGTKIGHVAFPAEATYGPNMQIENPIKELH